MSWSQAQRVQRHCKHPQPSGVTDYVVKLGSGTTTSVRASFMGQRGHTRSMSAGAATMIAAYVEGGRPVSKRQCKRDTESKNERGRLQGILTKAKGRGQGGLQFMRARGCRLLIWVKKRSQPH